MHSFFWQNVWPRTFDWKMHSFIGQNVWPCDGMHSFIWQGFLPGNWMHSFIWQNVWPCPAPAARRSSFCQNRLAAAAPPSSAMLSVPIRARFAPSPTEEQPRFTLP